MVSEQGNTHSSTHTLYNEWFQGKVWCGIIHVNGKYLNMYRGLHLKDDKVPVSKKCGKSFFQMG